MILFCHGGSFFKTGPLYPLFESLQIMFLWWMRLLKNDYLFFRSNYEFKFWVITLCFLLCLNAIILETGTWLVDPVSRASFSHWFWLPKDQSIHIMFFSVSSIVLLLLSVSGSCCARWTQALRSGFRSWSIWCVRSRGVQSQKLIL